MATIENITGLVILEGSNHSSLIDLISKFEVYDLVFLGVMVSILVFYVIPKTIIECKKRDLSKETFFEKIKVFIKECIPWVETGASLSFIWLFIHTVFIAYYIENPYRVDIYNKSQFINYVQFAKQVAIVSIPPSYKQNTVYIYGEQIKAPLEKICDLIVYNISNLDKEGIKYIYHIKSESKEYERYNNTYCILY